MKALSLTEELKKILGEDLKSVVLYGSAANGNATEGFSDVNLAIVAGSLSKETLDQLRPTLQRWVKAGHVLPVLFTPETLKNSRDVFPIEFLDIQDHHQILFGKDFFRSLKVNQANLRHQIDYELRAAIHKLRSNYILLADRPKELRTLMAEALSSVSVLFRGVLRLLNEPVPHAWPDVWAALGRRAAVDAEALNEIHRIRTGIHPSTDVSNLFERLSRTLEAVAGFLETQENFKEGV